MSSDNSFKNQQRQTRSAANPSATPNTTQHSQNSQRVKSQVNAHDLAATARTPSTPPRTPRKNNEFNSHPKSNSVPLEHATRHRPKNKSRPKNVNVSPTVTTESRHYSPPKSAGLSSATKAIATPSSTAYAGSTFHASPAPSALPKPSFYSKSVPDSPAGRLSLQNGHAAFGTLNSTKIESGNATESSRERTPLDFLFEADRLDKERARSATSTQLNKAASGPFEPPHSPNNSVTPTAVGQARPPNNHRHSGSMFPFEMDSPSISRSPVGPAFSTPYNERIKAARATSQPYVQQGSATQSSPNPDALKRYLFENTAGPQPKFSNASPSHSSHQRDPRETYGASNKWVTHTPQNGARSSGLRQEVTPTKTPNGTIDRTALLEGSSTPARTLWHPTDINHAVSTTDPLPYGRAPANQGARGSALQRDVNGIDGLDSHLRSVLKLAPARNS